MTRRLLVIIFKISTVLGSSVRKKTNVLCCKIVNKFTLGLRRTFKMENENQDSHTRDRNTMDRDRKRGRDTNEKRARNRKSIRSENPNRPKNRCKDDRDERKGRQGASGTLLARERNRNTGRRDEKDRDRNRTEDRDADTESLRTRVRKSTAREKFTTLSDILETARGNGDNLPDRSTTTRTDGVPSDTAERPEAYRNWTIFKTPGYMELRTLSPG